MGAILSIPTILNDIKKDVSELKTQVSGLDTRVSDLSTQVSSIESTVSKLYPDKGNDMARQATVSISAEGRNEPMGHGVVVDLAVGGTRCKFLLTAAHVIAGDICPLSSPLILRWDNNKTVQVPLANRRGVYLPRLYIEAGKQDVGMVMLTDWDNLTSTGDAPFLTVPLRLRSNDAYGEAVIGHGKVFMEGFVVGSVGSGRQLVNAISVPGCSGCPLFDNNKQLVALTHGPGKHRGRGSIHSFGGTSSFLYADSIHDVYLLKIDDTHHGNIQLAEDIDENLAADPDRQLENNELTGLRRNIGMEEGGSTLNSVMNRLADHIWDTPDNIETLTLNDALLVVVGPSQN